ncbi:hypothetical protein PROFUN_04153 [Planoprotostelium fungivorum]|uniref:Acyl-coenzyme A oxidase n=1 Tax=Planoprotostelium fungivorum TaxID=1890364 RepID=A0A2P6NJP8_9EUKA|nr:hypothetical protein PROFUN_04153 [Planoprotostelium fungivorum]
MDHIEVQTGVSRLERVAKDNFAKERDSAAFSIREMTHLLNGGKERTDARERAEQLMERDPEIKATNFFDNDRPTDRARTMALLRRHRELHVELEGKDDLLSEWLLSTMESYDRSSSMRLYVHQVLFRETIWAQGTSEQWKEYEQDIHHMRVLGCYSMTELGHSSHLPGLETTATFDRQRDEFVIHSPSITATKWWIGMSGQAATHTVVLAQLMIDGKNHGLHWFIVPLRSRDTGRLHPGVTAGDIGAKVGRQGLDNGWIQFSQVRVPRKNMLARWATVTREGKYTPPQSQALVYASLIGERLLVLPGLYDMVSQAVTIAVRYGVARVQGGINKQLMDFQAHQTSLMPIVAITYGLNINAKVYQEEWKKRLNLSQVKGREKEFIELSQEMHSISAGFKAWFGWWAAEAFETIRRTMGGHAYSSYNAVGGLIADFGVITAGGGDNTVLAQQTARYLFSGLKRSQQKKSLAESIKYLERAEQSHAHKFDLNTEKDRIESMEFLSLSCLRRAAQGLMDRVSEGGKMEDAWNHNMGSLLDASKSHTYYLMIHTFWKYIQTVEREDLRKVLTDLLELSSFHFLERLASLLMEHQILQASEISFIRGRVVELCAKLRHQALPLVDAFGESIELVPFLIDRTAWPDWIIKAPLGRYDGAIYSNYHNIIKSAPRCFGTPDYWATSVAPLTKSNL